MPNLAAQRLRARLDGRIPILLDGGLRGALQRMNAISDDALGTASVLSGNSHLLSAVHQRFCAAGAHMVRANTAETTSRALARTGYGYRAAKLTSFAVDVATEAAQASGRAVSVCGVLPAVEDADVRLRGEQVAHAQRLLAAGCDAIFVGVAQSLRGAVAATAAAAETGLPVFVALSVGEQGDLLDGERLEVACGVLAGVGGRGFIAAPTDPAGEIRATGELSAMGRPWGVWCAGEQGLPPAEYGARACELMEEGASLFGGEDFVTERHVQVLASQVPGAERELYRFTLSPPSRASLLGHRSLPSLWSHLPPRK